VFKQPSATVGTVDDVGVVRGEEQKKSRTVELMGSAEPPRDRGAPPRPRSTPRDRGAPPGTRSSPGNAEPQLRESCEARVHRQASDIVGEVDLTRRRGVYARRPRRVVSATPSSPRGRASTDSPSAVEISATHMSNSVARAWPGRYALCMCMVESWLAPMRQRGGKAGRTDGQFTETDERASSTLDSRAKHSVWGM